MTAWDKDLQFAFWYSPSHDIKLQRMTSRIYTVMINGSWVPYTSVSLPTEDKPLLGMEYADYRKLGIASLADTRVA